MRKFWFAYLAKALVVFPGGFGTIDELFEILTLEQTKKLADRTEHLPVWRDYWDRVLISIRWSTGARVAVRIRTLAFV